MKSYLSKKSGLKPEFCCQATVRELYNLPCTKNLALRQSIDVNLVSNSCTIFHALKTWLSTNDIICKISIFSKIDIIYIILDV